MKKYFVSLAVKVPCNFEIEVNADSRNHAFQEALKAWEHDSTLGDMSDPEWHNTELDITTSKKPTFCGDGIHIEEV